ncbi:MAG: hypothetical protein JSV86_12645 [Gemmatimonadota bacterium]|nr:MAG: hypothetical protein JSV86_12645 [Gemmatimonadota bacterium]
MKQAAQRGRSERGFSLLTVLIAIVLVSVAVVALSGTTVYVLSLRTESGVRATATGIAASYMEEVKTRRVLALASESGANVDELGDVDTAGQFVRSLIVAQGPVPNSKLLTITVLYPRGRAQMGKVELVTIVYEGLES